MKIFLKPFLAVAAIIALVASYSFATGITTIAPVNVNVPNPTLGPFVFISTNQFTNVITFPTAYPSTITPIVTVALSGTNQFTNVVTSTNFTISTASSTNSIMYTTTWPYSRIQSGQFGFGSFIAGAVTVTNVYPVPYTATPILDISAQGSLFATNAGVWVVTNSPTLFIIQTGDTNQIIQWGALGQCTAPGINTPSN